MDMLQVAPMVWMMMTYLAGRFIVGQCVCLAFQADLVMILGQAVVRGKTKAMGIHLGPHVDNLTTAGWLLLNFPNLWHPLAHPNMWDSGKVLIAIVWARWLEQGAEANSAGSDNNCGNQHLNRRERTVDRSCLFKQAHLLVCPVRLWRLSAPRIEAPCFLLSVTHWTSGWRNSGFETGLSVTGGNYPLLAEENSLRAFLFPFSLGRLAFSSC